jgi:hypothetical protein
MKKILLPLLLILAVGLLAAVESEPSEVVGYVKYDCLEGLNLIALPMNQGFVNASEVGILLGSDAVSKFDATLQDWVSTYDDGSGNWAEDFPLSIGSPFMAYSYIPQVWPAYRKNIIQKDSISKEIK